MRATCGCTWCQHATQFQTGRRTWRRDLQRMLQVLLVLLVLLVMLRQRRTCRTAYIWGRTSGMWCGAAWLQQWGFTKGKRLLLLLQRLQLLRGLCESLQLTLHEELGGCHLCGKCRIILWQTQRSTAQQFHITIELLLQCHLTLLQQLLKLCKILGRNGSRQERII